MKFNTIFLSGMACSFGPFFAVAQQATKPNVVVIMADDIGYGDLSCYGEKTIHTPNVEKLADGGVMFTDAHSVAATSTCLAAFGYWCRSG